MAGAYFAKPSRSSPSSLTQRANSKQPAFAGLRHNLPSEEPDASACFASQHLSIDHPPLESAVSVDAPVTQKRPMSAMLIYPIPFYVGHHDLFFVRGTFCNDFAVWSANKTLSPKFDAVASG